ncbi:hypothetical protein QP922_11760 [Corynebacterium sp. MSK218]|uniref:hypothetical protein n=1 Tax=Corynebacterium sp. MSK218 TaxID=3050218 RepID=UPI00254EADD7|nr:hypothetical protein [Corynebacterium sp. MSK218]MDK8764491.1 hypothetical protein [Corynebacterium sp. MSK218]
MFLTLSIIVIIAALLWSAWRALTTPGHTISRLVSAAITALTLLVIGYALPWNASISFGWWYALVAACAVYAGAVAWRAGEPKAPHT